MLWDLVSNNVRIIDEIEDWKSAINLVAEPLVSKGLIEPRYIKAMVEMCEKYNGYIVLNDFFAMPHASFDNGVNKLGASLLIVRNSIDFMGKPVNIVLAIAPENNHSHIGLIQDVSVYFNNVDFIIELSKVEKIEQINSLIKKYYGEEVIGISELAL